jgi:ABC transport system ATP-binding/permease protein
VTGNSDQSGEAVGAPSIVLEWGGRERRLTPGVPWSIGRDPDNDIVVDDTWVSRHHGELAWVERGWVYRDLNSRHGSWVAGQQVTEVVVREAIEVRVGSIGGASIRLTPTQGPPVRKGIATRPRQATDDTLELGRPAATHRIGGREFIIGRGPGNDVVLSSLRASRRHAVIRAIRDGRFEIQDLGSSNGTFVNGSLVEVKQLEESDVVSFGGEVFRFERGTLREYVESEGAWLCAINVGVSVARDTHLLQNINFALGPAQLLGIVGPSGSGKSTLLKALTSQQVATDGRILYGGRDLSASTDLRSRMGYVPQDDLLHPQLTVRQALDFAAQLRFATDVDRVTRTERIDEVMIDLGLEGRADLPIRKLSGGQRKRTSVAAELLTRPPLLFLDEPTSGLDPGNEEQLTRLLRQLADDGRTIVTATHSLVTIERCDRVLFLAAGGHEVYYGPPSAADAYFRFHDLGETYPHVFVSLGGADGAAMAKRFEADPAQKEYVAGPLTAAARISPNRIHERVGRTQTRHRRQFSVLVRRHLAVLRADRFASLLLIAQAPFFALLFALLYPKNVMTSADASEATVLIWLLLVGATWIGTSNAIREIVKELPIIKREHSLGLSPVVYLASKAGVLGVITTVECAFLAVAGLALQQLPPSDPIGSFAFASSGLVVGSRLPEFGLDVTLAGLAAMGLGLLISAAVRNADQANFALPLILVAQIVLSAPLLGNPSPLFSVVGSISSAQWGTAASGATMSLNDLRKPYLDLIETQKAQARKRAVDPAASKGSTTWEHTLAAWVTDIAALLLLAIVAVGSTLLVLRRQLAPEGHRSG